MFQGKAIIVVGARQVGKTTLLNSIIKEYKDENILFLNCDEPEVKEALTNINTPNLKLLISNNRIIVIDEAQRVNEIGLTLKRIVDNFPDIQLLVTGSSSLDLKNKLNEPLTGRKYEYNLYPISTQELLNSAGLISVKQTLESRLIYGSYPDILNNPDNAKELLLNIADSYLYKDILSIDSLRKPALLEKLLMALALQVTSEVSFNELAQTLGTDNKTVEKYITLLEECYVIFRLNGFNRNLRSELKKSKKIYFYDNGIRNAIIQNFKPLSLRQDTGALWENFLISERLKLNKYTGHNVISNFWRTRTQQEIDYIEESDGSFSIFEIKWNQKKKNVKFPESFLEAYDVRDKKVITPENWLDFVIQQN